MLHEELTAKIGGVFEVRRVGDGFVDRLRKALPRANRKVVASPISSIRKIPGHAAGSFMLIFVRGQSVIELKAARALTRSIRHK